MNILKATHTVGASTDTVWMPAIGDVLDGVHTARWRNLANTTELPVCGGDAAYVKLM